MEPFSALIGAGASLLGGSMNAKAAASARDASIQEAYENRKAQYDFAQAGIRWKVEDAKRAGIHPLYALGASTPSFSPVSSNFTADTSMGNAVANAGQDIGRAINATRSQTERTTAFNEAVQKLTLEKMGLENSVLRQDLLSKTARLNQQANPPMPIGDRYLIPGQTQSGVTSSLNVPSTLINDQAMKRTASSPSSPWQEPGAINDAGFARTSGGLYPVPSNDVKERIEDNFFHEAAHFARNNLLPMISPKFNDPPYAAPKGKAWVFDPIYGYKLVPDQWHRKFFRY